MKSIIMILMITYILTKDVPVLKSADCREEKIIDFLKDKLDKIVFFLDDMANATYISQRTKQTFHEIKDYVKLMEQDRQSLKD